MAHSKPVRICEGCSRPTMQFPALFTSCKSTHESDHCGHCWNQYLAVKIFQERCVPAPCIHFEKCRNLLTRSEVAKIGNREILGHYDYLLRLHEANTDNEVECLATYTDPMDGKQKTCHHFQSQDTTNRTSTCESCATVSCIPCGRIPEHHTETCSQYQSRMHREHGEEEAATRSALESGYSGIEQGSKKLYVTPKQVQHRPVRCPGAGCGILIERMKGGGCGHMICPLCKSHFCSMCGAHYFGVGGVYDVGNAAHAAECTYAKRKVEDWRFERKRKIDRVEGRGEEEMGSAKSRKGADVLANEDGAVGKSARKDDRVK